MSNNVLRFPRQKPLKPEEAGYIDVLGADFQRRLAAANAVLRKLRDWGVGVDALCVPSSRESGMPMQLRIDPRLTIKPLLDATQSTRRWLPGTGCVPDRMVAELDQCLLVWLLVERRRAPDADSLRIALCDRGRPAPGGAS